MRFSIACMAASGNGAAEHFPPPPRPRPPATWCASRNGIFNRAHQPVGEIGGGGIALARGLAHAGDVRRHVADHAGHGGKRQHQGCERVHRAFFVLLHVLLVRQREPLHHDQQCLERADNASGLRPHQLGGIRVALLRHDRGAGGEAVRERDEADEGRAPDHDLLGEARQVHRRDRGGGQRLQDEVAVGDRVERVRHRPLEPERLGGHVAVDRERGTGQRRGAERGLVRPLARIGEPAAVAPRHLHIGQKMMSECYRLRGLQMGEPGITVAACSNAFSASACW